MTIRVRVPATSANLGAGFDSFGLALSLYNEIEIGSGEPGVTIHSDDARQISSGTDNIAWRAADRLLRKLGCAADFRLQMWNAIPLSRGLGSSAAARVGALVAANQWARQRGEKTATREELLDLATELEGHPDNAAAAFLGGLTVAVVANADPKSTPENRRTFAVQMPVKRFPRFVVFSPDSHLETKTARAALPESVSHADAVFNLSRAGLLLAALSSGDFEILPEALKDRLHQNQRAALLPGWSEISRAATESGALGVTLSGAGSSILIWLPPEDEIFSAATNSVRTAAANSGVAGTVRELEVDTQGAMIIA